MYLSIQFRRNLQYVFGNKSGTRIKRIFTEITKRTNKKQSVSFSFCLDKTYHPLRLMKFHHRRHFAQCLSLRNFLYVGRFSFRSKLEAHEQLGNLVLPNISCSMYQGVSPPFLQFRSSEATGDRDGHTQPLLYLHVSLGRFVRFAFLSRFVSFELYRQGVSLISPSIHFSFYQPKHPILLTNQSTHGGMP